MNRNKLSSLLQQVSKDNVELNKEYGLSDLNWKDDGDELHDPSMNDYLKGYNMEPYQFTQYAQKNILYKVKEGDTIGSIAVYANTKITDLYKLNGFDSKKITSSKTLKAGSKIIVDRVDFSAQEKETLAAKEMIDITYTPENLADEILTIWSQVDGPLQNFFDGFTMNKMDNKMKKEIADILNERGYEITPTYTQDTPIYAKAYEKFKKIASSRNPLDIVKSFAKLFPDSKVLSKFAEELEETQQQSKTKVTKVETSGLVDYYKQIFPDDYAMALVDVALNKPNASFDEFKDESISDEALNQMEKEDSGNQNPTSNQPNNGGMGGYDFTTQMRSDGPGGVAPTNYETRASRVKKK